MKHNTEAGMNIDALGDKTAKMMMLAAVRYLESQGWSRERIAAASDALLAGLRSEISDAVAEALRDARDAHEAGMSHAAGLTFAATMTNAGIRAAKMLAA